MVAMSFFYEITCGRIIKFRKKSASSLFFLIKLTGFDSLPDKRFGITDPNSGDLVFFLGPLFLWARKQFAVQGLLQLPIGQDIFGIQPQYDFRASIGVEVKF